MIEERRLFMQLVILPEMLAVCRLAPDQPIPQWVHIQRVTLLSITYTEEELSIVCPEIMVPSGVQRERAWRALKVQGPLDFSLTGILASLAGPLAEQGIAIFALSTYDTDYMLVKSIMLERACAMLRQHGHEFLK